MQLYTIAIAGRNCFFIHMSNKRFYVCCMFSDQATIFFDTQEVSKPGSSHPLNEVYLTEIVYLKKLLASVYDKGIIALVCRIIKPLQVQSSTVILLYLLHSNHQHLSVHSLLHL